MGPAPGTAALAPEEEAAAAASLALSASLKSALGKRELLSARHAARALSPEDPVLAPRAAAAVF